MLFNQDANDYIVVVQTMLKAPDPIRTPKLSNIRHGQY
jgi:hypothetical protein